MVAHRLPSPQQGQPLPPPASLTRSSSRRSVAPGPRTARIHGSRSDICNAPHHPGRPRPAHQPPQLWLLLRVFKTTCTTSCVPRTQWQCRPLLWPHPSDPQPGFLSAATGPDVQVKGPHCPRRCTAGTEASHDSHQGQQSPPEGAAPSLVDTCPWPPLRSVPTIRDQFAGAGDECGPVPDAHGLDVQTVGAAAGPGAQ